MAKKPNTSTKKQKAIAILAESVGTSKPKTVGQAMIEAGYSPETATSHPERITSSDEFHLAMREAGIDFKKMATVLSDGLNATKAVVMGKESTESFVDVQPDHPTRHKYLETSLRLAGLGQKQGEGSTNNFIQVINNKSDKYSD